MDLQLKGKRALVTGGSRGIGKAIARQLALEGVDCAICSRTEASLQAAAAELAQETGQRFFPFVADMARADDITQLVSQAAEALGGIDILINNGARVSGGVPEDFANLDEHLLIRDFEEKVVGYFRVIRAVVPYMRTAGWGRIINLSGLSARRAGGISAGARNAAVVNLTKALSGELGPAGINVNAIYPTLTMTETLGERMAGRAQTQGISVEALLAQSAANVAIRRIVTAEEIAYVATFLASPLAVGITGEVVAVTGGAGANVYY
jgi:NAD(P)-dependent dehydrogenase (short-subunit alcohol dehydrogenase family)